MVKQSIDICEKKGVLGSGYIPKTDQTTCTRELEGAVRLLPVRGSGLRSSPAACPTASGSGWAGITGVKDLEPDRSRSHISEVAADKALKSQKPRALEPGRYTVILEPRANARFLSLMTGIFNARAVETGPRSYLTGTEKGTSKLGQKVFSDLFTLKSDIGNQILRQTPILARQHAGEAGDVGRKGRAQEPLLRPAVGDAHEEGPDAGDGQHEPGAWKARTCRSRT